MTDTQKLTAILKQLEKNSTRLASIEKNMATKTELKNGLLATEKRLREEIVKNRREIIHARDLLLEPIYRRLDRLEKVTFNTN